MWGVGGIVTCYISSRDEAEHHEDPHEHGVNGGLMPCPHPLQALSLLPGPCTTSFLSSWGQAAPSDAYTTSLLLPLQHMKHSLVKPL